MDSHIWYDLGHLMHVFPRWRGFETAGQIRTGWGDGESGTKGVMRVPDLAVSAAVLSTIGDAKTVWALTNDVFCNWDVKWASNWGRVVNAAAFFSYCDNAGCNNER